MTKTNTRYDMYEDVKQVLAQKRGQQYLGRFIKGLPIGLKISDTVTIGA